MPRLRILFWHIDMKLHLKNIDISISLISLIRCYLLPPTIQFRSCACGFLAISSLEKRTAWALLMHVSRDWISCSSYTAAHFDRRIPEDVPHEMAWENGEICCLWRLLLRKGLTRQPGEWQQGRFVTRFVHFLYLQINICRQFSVYLLSHSCISAAF